MTDESPAGAARPATRYPPVSVVVATRDRPGLLERAVTSVLEQDYPAPVQCVVVYDGVPVRVLDVPVPPGRQLVHVANRRTPGLPGGRNSGCDASSGTMLGFCDDDDRWHPDKLRRQIDALDGDSRFSAVTCGIRLEGPGIRRDRPGRATPVTLDDLLADRIMEAHPSSLLVHRDVVRTVGPVDEQIPGGYAEDYEWLLRIAARGPIAVVDEPLVVVEWHGGSFFFGRWAVIVDALRYLLERHPEFGRSPRGRARIHGQIAFALAAGGRRREAVSELRTVLRLNRREKRVAATVPVLLGLLSGDRVLRLAQSRGRGV
ncbi:MAG: glycosyltransferase family A protein [Actinocatenispora sp.]